MSSTKALFKNVQHNDKIKPGRSLASSNESSSTSSRSQNDSKDLFRGYVNSNDTSNLHTKSLPQSSAPPMMSNQSYSGPPVSTLNVSSGPPMGTQQQPKQSFSQPFPQNQTASKYQMEPNQNDNNNNKNNNVAEIIQSETPRTSYPYEKQDNTSNIPLNANTVSPKSRRKNDNTAISYFERYLIILNIFLTIGILVTLVGLSILISSFHKHNKLDSTVLLSDIQESWEEVSKVMELITKPILENMEIWGNWMNKEFDSAMISFKYEMNNLFK
jgi:hypothetical protein